VPIRHCRTRRCRRLGRGLSTAARAARRTDAGRIAATFSRHADEGGDFPAGRLIADAQLAATRRRRPNRLHNPGGVRAELTPHGDGTAHSDLFTMQPFGNSLVTLTLNGAQLKALLELQWRRIDAERARMLQPRAGSPTRGAGTRPMASGSSPARCDLTAS